MVKVARGALLTSIVVDRASRFPITTQICTAIRNMILSGALGGGERLPSSRTLARELDVSRTTIIGVFDHLTEEGLIEAHTGAGSFVCETRDTHLTDLPLPSPKTIAKRRGNLKLSRCLVHAVDSFAPRIVHTQKPFTTGIPAFDRFPLTQWSRLTARHYRKKRDIIMGYGDPEGYLPLRKAIAAHLRGYRGVACGSDQVFIVSGAQQAFNLICRVLLNPGDKVWIENPGPIGARNSLYAHGMKLIPVPVDEQGIMVGEGSRRSEHFDLALITPSHQQPMGVVMSLARRVELLHAAEESDAWILEDDYDGEFRYNRAPMPTLQSLDTTERVIYVGTFSKSLFPALRLGYMVVPPVLVRTFEKVSEAFLQGVPSNLQAILADFIAEGYFAAHIRTMCQVYAARYSTLVEASESKLQGLLRVMPTETGFHTVGTLAEGLPELRVNAAATRVGLSVSPISRYCIKPVSTNGLVLGFGTTRHAEIKAGIDLLYSVLKGVRNAATGGC